MECHLYAEVITGILIKFVLRFSYLWCTNCSPERKNVSVLVSILQMSTYFHGMRENSSSILY